MLFDSKAAIKTLFDQVPLLAPAANEIAGTARLCVEFTPAPILDFAAAPIGATRLGGLPDLPRGMPWPEWRLSKDNWRIERLGVERIVPRFLAQIALAQVPATTLIEIFGTGFPTRGHLWFFQADMEATQAFGLDRSDRGATVVMWNDCPVSDLVRINAPHGTAVYPAAHLELHIGWTLPASGVYVERTMASLRPQGCDGQTKLDFYDSVNETLGYRTLNLHKKFRLGGWSGRQQDREFRLGPDFDPPIVNNCVSIEEPAIVPAQNEWRPLFTFGCFSPSKMEWGDLDVLCVYSCQGDLDQQDFSRAWGLECGG